MMCFTLEALKNFLVLLVIVCLVIASVRLLVPAIMDKFGFKIPDVALTWFGYIMWAVIFIFIIIVGIDLIQCISAGGFRLGILPRS